MSKYKVGLSWERKGIESKIVAVVRNSEDGEFVECLIEERRPHPSNEYMETFYVHQQFHDAPVYDVVLVETNTWIYKFNQEPVSIGHAQEIMKQNLKNQIYSDTIQIKIIENKGSF